MGAVFAYASRSTEISTAPPDAIATGLRVTFELAGALIAAALALAAASQCLARRAARGQ